MTHNRIIPIPMGVLPNSYAVAINMSIDEDYILSAQLVDQNGNTMGNAQTIDLPLESVIVNGRYDDSTQSLILVLDNGNEITIPIGGIVSGLQEEITTENPLSADLLTDGTNNKIFTAAEQTKLSGIESGAEVNVQANWNESDSSADSYIQNKPVLATVATSGDYEDLTNKPTIPAAQVNSDWNASSGVAQILNKPTLATVATSGSYNDLSNTPTLGTMSTESASDYTKTANLATVATTGDYDDLSNKPTIPTTTSQLTNDSGYITGIDSSDVVSALGYTPGTSNFSGSYNDLTNKPDLSIYAQSANLSTVATSGSYNDLSNKPTIPTVNDATITLTQGGTTKGTFTLNQNTNATIDFGEGLTSVDWSDVNNKPNFATVATTGDYDDLSNKPTIPTTTSELTNDSGYITGIDSSDVVSALGYTPGTSNFSGSYNDLSNKPTIPAAQVNSDWTANSGVSQILNKPNLATVATSGSYNDLSNTPTIPVVDVTAAGDNTFSGNNTFTNYTVFGDETIQMTSIDGANISTYDNTTGDGVNVSVNQIEIANAYDTSLVISSQTYNNETISQISSVGSLDIIGSSVSVNGENIATESYVNTAISNIPSPMIFKGSLGTGGTITTLPSASSANEGFTYKVITDGTYASQSAKVGDIFISNGSAWILIPSGDEPSGTVSSVGITVPTGLTVSGSPITSSGTIAISLDNGYSIPTTTKQTQWDAKSDFSGSYNDLSNKPDLSVYAQSANLATVATSGSYNDLSNKPTIPTVNNATISITDSNGTALGSFTTNDNTNQTIVVPAAQIQSDWNQSNSSAVDYIKNKPDLSVYAQSANLATVATSGSYNDLSNKPTIPAAQVNSDWNSNSGVSQILNKPTLATVATSGSYNDLSNKPTIPTVDITAAGDNTFTGTNTFDEGGSICITNPDVSSNNLALTSDNIIVYNDDAQTEITTNGITLNDVSYGMGELYPNSISFITTNGNQLNISISEEDDGQGNITGETYFESQFDINITSDNNINLNGDVVITTNNGTATIDGNNIITDNQLASVATSGSYNDLTNLPTIPAAQVNSDWNASSGVSQILNKPTLATVATSGSYNDLSNKPTIPAAQVNSDWNASSGVSQILNKPTLATVATSGSYNDLSNKPTIPAAQVQADWAETDSTDMSYIANKPSTITMEVVFTDQTTGTYNLYFEPTV